MVKRKKKKETLKTRNRLRENSQYPIGYVAIVAIICFKVSCLTSSNNNHLNRISKTNAKDKMLKSLLFLFVVVVVVVKEVQKANKKTI